MTEVTRLSFPFLGLAGDVALRWALALRAASSGHKPSAKRGAHAQRQNRECERITLSLPARGQPRPSTAFQGKGNDEEDSDLPARPTHTHTHTHHPTHTRPVVSWPGGQQTTSGITRQQELEGQHRAAGQGRAVPTSPAVTQAPPPGVPQPQRRGPELRALRVKARTAKPLALTPGLRRRSSLLADRS